MRGLVFIMMLAVCWCSGCGAGRGQVVIQSHQVVLPDGSQAKISVLVIPTPIGDPSVDVAINTAQHAATAFWSSSSACGAWTELAYEIRKGMTRDRYVKQLRTQQMQEWYRIEKTPRDKAEAYERQLQLFDTVSRHLTAGTCDEMGRSQREHAATLIPPAAAAYKSLASIVQDDDALLHVVAAYDQGVLAALQGNVRQGHVCLDEATSWAVRHVPVEIIRQCAAGHREIDALDKQRILFGVDERNRQQQP
jgi:hypothetical protein